MTATVIDAKIRHQIYIERVKNYERRQYDETFGEIAAAVTLLLLALPTQKLNELPAARFNKFVRDVRKTVNRIYNKFAKKMRQRLRSFIGDELFVTKAVMKALTGKSLTRSQQRRVTENKLIEAFEKETIPANGYAPMLAFAALSGIATGKIERMLRIARANNWTVEELRRGLFADNGMPQTGKHANRNRNDFGSMIETVIQAAAMFVMGAVESIYTPQYQWVSILDSGTTDTCRSRHNNVYEYGRGPVPPAHYGCRSSIVPLLVGIMGDTPVSYYKWLTGQPYGVQQQMVGQRAAKQLKAGSASAEDFSRFVPGQPMPSGQLRNKVEYITA